MAGSVFARRRQEKFSVATAITRNFFGVRVVSKPGVRIFLFGDSRLNRHLILPTEPNVFQKILVYFLLKIRWADYVKRIDQAAIFTFPRNAGQVFKW